MHECLKHNFFVGMEALKFVNLQYTNDVLVRELIIVVALCILESVRIYLGKQGSLSDHGEYDDKFYKQSICLS
jgi:Predicted membrane protein